MIGVNGWLFCVLGDGGWPFGQIEMGGDAYAGCVLINVNLFRACLQTRGTIVFLSKALLII